MGKLAAETWMRRNRQKLLTIRERGQYWCHWPSKPCGEGKHHATKWHASWWPHASDIYHELKHMLIQRRTISESKHAKSSRPQSRMSIDGLSRKISYAKNINRNCGIWLQNMINRQNCMLHPGHPMKGTRLSMNPRNTIFLWRWWGWYEWMGNTLCTHFKLRIRHKLSYMVSKMMKAIYYNQGLLSCHLI